MILFLGLEWGKWSIGELLGVVFTETFNPVMSLILENADKQGRFIAHITGLSRQFHVMSPMVFMIFVAVIVVID